MKTLHIQKYGWVAASALLATILFYDTYSLGVNTIIFTSFLCIILSIKKRIHFENKWIATFLFLNAASLLLINQTITIIILFVNGFILLGSFDPRLTNSLYRLFQGLLDAFMTLFYKMAPDTDKGKEETNSEEKSSALLKKILPYLITAPIVYIFFHLYKSGNPLVELYISKINFDFIDFGTILFFLAAFFFSYPIFRGPATIWNGLSVSGKTTILRSDKEVDEIGASTFKTVFYALSGLLACFHLIDISPLLMGGLPAGMSMTDYLHQGFWTLVFTVILSVVMVVFAFRDQLNFHEEKKKLSLITCIWLGLNIVLVISTFIKNFIYVSDFGLTYKRIAVFAFLLVSIGLIVLCYVKVIKNYRIDYFLGKGLTIIVAFITFFSIVPWDNLITTYNFSEPSKNIDFNYLLSLNNNDLVLLKNENNTALPTYNRLRITTELNARQSYRKTHSDWRSWTLNKELVHKYNKRNYEAR